MEQQPTEIPIKKRELRTPCAIDPRDLTPAQPATNAIILIILIVIVRVAASRYDLSTWGGRFRHFLEVTDCRNLLASSSQYERAHRVVQDYEQGREVPDDELWSAKKRTCSRWSGCRDGAPTDHD